MAPLKALALLLLAVPPQGVPEITLGARTGAITEPFSSAMGIAELPDGRVIVSDRVEQVFAIADFKTGARRTIGRNGTGPNEYLIPFGPIRWRGDTLLGYDPNNRRLLRMMSDGSINGSFPFPSLRRDGVNGWSTPRFADQQGRVYWDTPIIEMQPAVKRSMKARIVRWLPGTDSVDVPMEFADHGAFEHEFRFRPMPQTDAWVVTSDGRIGIISAAEYRLRWYRDGALVSTGPVVPFSPTRITSVEREAFRERKAMEPAGGGMNVSGGAPAAPNARQDMARVRAAWPDSIFPAVMPPFEPNGAFLAPNGNIWLKRTAPAAATRTRVDILDSTGKLRGTLLLPPRARLFALGIQSVYLLAVDADGFQTLERYDYPTVR